MKKRFLSAFTALALCLSLVPAPVWAAETDDTGLCPHHRSHTDECGYSEPTEGASCTHEHTAECYTLGVLPEVNSTYTVAEDAENRLDCPHAHDETCGYVPEEDGAPCAYECRI